MKINILKITPVFLIIILVSLEASALINMEIDVDSYFSIENEIKFEYSILSNIDQSISYFASVKCPNLLDPLLKLEKAELRANVPYEKSYSYIQVDDSIEPQNCIAQVSLIEPFQRTVSKEFNIIAKKSFGFDIVLDKKVLILGEEIKINFDSEVENLDIEANLRYPNGAVKQINLPYLEKIKKEGTYVVRVRASKDNYKSITKEKEFGVIRENAKIKKADFSGNIIKFYEDDGSDSVFYLIVLFIMGLIIGLIALIYFIYKNRPLES